MTELYIDGELVDLQDEKIAITKQSKTIDDLWKIQSSYSNVFTLPLTKRNRAIFLDVDRPESQNAETYEIKEATLIVNGTSILKQGKAVIESVSDNSVSLSVYDGFIAFYELIKEKKLSDYSLGFFTFDRSSFSTYRDNILFPIMDCGIASGAFEDSGTVWATQVIPGYDLYYLMSFIVSEHGYARDFESDMITWCRNHALLFTNLIPADRQIKFSATGVGDNIVSSAVDGTDGTPLKLGFSEVIDTDNNFASDRFTAKFRGVYKFSYTTNIVGLFSEIYLRIRLDIYKNGVSVADLTYSTSNGEIFNATISAQVTLAPDDYIEVYATALDVGAPNTEYYQAKLLPTGSEFKLNSYSFIPYAYGDLIQPKYFVPEMTVVDLMKTMAAMAGGVWEVDEANLKLKFRKFDQLLTNTSEDWSDRFRAIKSVSFDIGFASKSKFVYSHDDKTEYGKPGDTTLAVEKADTDEKEIIKLPFAGFNNSDYTIDKLDKSDNFEGNYALLSLPIYSRSGDNFTLQEKRIKPRIVSWFASKLYLKDNSGDFTVSPTYGKVAIFNNYDSTKDIDWSSIITRHYDAVTDMLDKSKKVIALMVLYDFDLQMDMLTPVYISSLNGTFYVNKINNYISGQPCEVELIRI